MIFRLAFLIASCSVFMATAAEAPADLAHRARRILADKCYACHGPDAERREAELRLDVREGALADRGGYAPVVPGHPEKSALIERLVSNDPDTRMPPPESGKELSAAEIELIRRWIEVGAPYQEHWSFRPLHHAAPPTGEHAAENPNPFVRNGVDLFVLRRLREAGITPSASADRSTLIRRLYLDLLGLLPDPAEVERFLHDDQPLAYERLVEQLLASPHYGERWGRHWLDQARYADSNGYTIDGERSMWPYRDWVIRTLNRDQPFDQFTIEQLAGDLLPNPSREQLIATGFHRNTLINQEGGTDPEQFRIEAVMDRVSTTGAVWLGLTIGCAQCHNHKFDPISQREYYQFYAFFNHGADINNVGPTLDVYQDELFLKNDVDTRFQSLQHAIRDVDRLQAEQGVRRARWEETVLAGASEKQSPQQLPWHTLPIAAAKGEGATLSVLEDHSVVATAGVLREIYVIDTAPLPKGTSLASFQLRVLPHESLPRNGPGLAANGNFAISAVEAYLGNERLPLAAAIGTYAETGAPVASLIDDNPSTAWGVYAPPDSPVKMNAEHVVWFTLGRSLVADGQPLRFILKHELKNEYNVGRFQIAWSSDPVDATTDLGLLAAIRTPSDRRTKDQVQAIDAAFGSADIEFKEARDRVDVLRRNIGFGAAAPVMVMRDMPERRPTYVLTRGDFLRPDKDGGSIEPDVLQCLPPLDNRPDQPVRSRLDLARWLVRPDNPLTPRVTVNRIWMRYFGRGLVETENDFGTQGSPPTHPELLDWLARQLIESGWSQKHLHRLIVTSGTYRQSSHTRADVAAIDALNVLLSRQNRLRLDAEIVRDACLCVSGNWSARLGGPSVQPPQPEGVYAFTQNRKNWQTATGASRFRRAMYTMFYRSAPYPSLTTFDSPDFQSVCTRRVRSNTPLQALTMANDEALYELAQGFAKRLRTTAADSLDASQVIQQAFLMAYARRPTQIESQRVQQFVELQLATATPEMVWTTLARALVNTDEFVTRE